MHCGLIGYYRITRGILQEHQSKCGYASVECDGYKQFMDSLGPFQRASSPDSTKNNNNNTAYSYNLPSILQVSNRSSLPQPLGGSTNSGTHSNRNSVNSDILSTSPTLPPAINLSPALSPVLSPRISLSPQTVQQLIFEAPADWSANSISKARPCGEFLKKDLQNHKSFQCPFRYSFSSNVFLVSSSFFYISFLTR